MSAFSQLEPAGRTIGDIVEIMGMHRTQCKELDQEARRILGSPSRSGAEYQSAAGTVSELDAVKDKLDRIEVILKSAMPSPKVVAEIDTLFEETRGILRRLDLLRPSR